MSRFQNVYQGRNRTRQLRFNPAKALCFAAATAAIAWFAVINAQAQSVLNHGYSPVPDAPPTAIALRFVAVNLKAKELQPRTTFAVFLEGDYLGKFTTNADGRGSMRIAPTYSSTRRSLNRAVLRFRNPSADDICFSPVEVNTETAASLPRNIPERRVASVATAFIVEAFSLEADASSLHFINWRSNPCVSTF